MSDISHPLVQVIDAHKAYPLGRRSVVAVDGVTLEVPRRAFVAIQGPSGSGKTTLLNLIGCIDHPTSGRIVVSGQDVSALPDAALSRFRAEKLGFIFQSFNLIPVLSAFENIEYALLLHGVPKAGTKERVMAMLEAVGLADVSDHRPGELSGGQCQRVAIARALVTDPELVIADEPTANLDSTTGQAVVDLMHEMRNRTGTTFVISTHDPSIAALAELRFMLRDGKLQDA
jgi:putative ABC transport system ATP-binding protein